MKNFFKRFDRWLQRQPSIPDLNAINKFKPKGMVINTFDCDGVVQISPEIGGVHPGQNDVIITGRSFEEKRETDMMLLRRGIYNAVYYNPLPFDQKTRESSGQHKAKTIKQLQEAGFIIKAHFEDDPIQAKVVRDACPDVHVIMLVHGLTELENVRHLDE